MKKFLSLTLAACLCLSLCSVSLAETAVDPYGPVSDTKVAISIGRAESANVAYDEGENSADNYIVRYLEEKLNVDYNYAFSVDDSTYQTKVAMAIASGDIPDVMNVSYAQLVQLVDAEAVEDMTEAFATYSSDSLKKCFASSMGLAESLATFDGKLMAISNISPGMDAVPVLWVRQDWLDACGLQDPTTYEDVVNVANTFIKQNPSGKVTTGLVVASEYCEPNGGNYKLNGLFNSFGAYPEQWIRQEDGTVVYGSVTDQTKQALTAIRELVVAGTINPSFAVMDDEQCYELVANDQAGMWFGSWWGGQWPVVNIMGGKDDTVKFTPVLCPLSADGKVNVCGKSPSDSYIVVKKGCSEDVKEAVVKTVNYQYDIDQSQAEGIRPNGMDSNFSWHYYPINVLHCDYDAKEIQIAQVMDVIAGKMAYDDLSGDGKTWYNGYTTVMDKGFRSA
ncbi:MAG: extracellular solute-binding protein, partial [Clostridia bacterium]